MSAPRLPGIGEANSQRTESALRQLALQLQNEYAPLADPVFTGDPQAPTPSTSDNDTSIATTAYVKANLASYAPLASPALTGNPTAPTPSPGDNDTSIATTAFVTAAVAAVDLSGYVPNTRTVSTSTGLTGGGDLSANRTLSLADTAVTPGSYTFASITVDQQGRLTAASSGTPAWTTIFKSGDQSITSNITPADLTGLSISMDASSTYVARFGLFIVAGAGGARFDLNNTSAATLEFYSQGFSSGAGTALGTDITMASAGNYAVEGFVYITTNAATTFTIRGAQNSSNIAATVFKKGSYLEYRKVV